MQALGSRDTAVAVHLRAPRWERSLRASLAARMEVIAVAALAIATVGSRLVTRSSYLYNWDSVQYALGVHRFDLVAHRPHPPGYLGYIVLGRLFTQLLGGHPDQGLVLLSAVAEALAAVLLYLAARATWGTFAGWAAAILFATSPLAWIYGGVALNYALEPAFAVAVLWACLRAGDGRGRGLVVAAVLTALAGAIRPTDELFLAAPLALAAWGTWSRGQRREVIAGGGALVLASLAWLLPLLAASGGLSTYLTASRELSSRASGTSAVWSAGLDGVGRNGAAVVAGLSTALGLVVPLGATYLLCRVLPTTRRTTAPARSAYPALAVAAVVPPLAVYVLVHIGQLGYLLLVLPALILPAGVALQELAVAMSRRHATTIAGALLALCVVANLAIFAVPAGGMRDQVAQHDIYVSTLLSMVQRYDPASTVLITSAEADGSYRLAQYYLAQYPVIAVGRDRQGRAGEMFAAGAEGRWHPTAPEYDLARFERAHPLALPAAARTVVILDRGALDLVGDRGTASPVLFGDEWRLWSIPAPAAGVSPVISGRYLYLDAARCPCRGAAATRPLPVPHEPV